MEDVQKAKKYCLAAMSINLFLVIMVAAFIASVLPVVLSGDSNALLAILMFINIPVLYINICHLLDTVNDYRMIRMLEEIMQLLDAHKNREAFAKYKKFLEQNKGNRIVAKINKK